MQAQKATTGKLIHLVAGGKAVVLERDKPFWVLQNLKKEYILRGYKKENLKLTY